MNRRHDFQPSVTVLIGIGGLFDRVSSVERAADVLLTWPQHGIAWNAAVDMCRRAMEGAATAGQARRAFVEAALAKGNLVQG